MKVLNVTGMAMLVAVVMLVGCTPQQAQDPSDSKPIQTTEPAGETPASEPIQTAELANELPKVQTNEPNAIQPGHALRVDFSQDASKHFLGGGWGGTRAAGRWSVAETASIKFSLTEVSEPSISLQCYTFGEQRVLATLNGAVINVPDGIAIDLSDVQDSTVLTIPAELFSKENELVFEFPDRISPQEVSGAADTRSLGMRIAWIEIAN